MNYEYSWGTTNKDISEIADGIETFHTFEYYNIYRSEIGLGLCYLGVPKYVLSNMRRTIKVLNQFRHFSTHPK